MIRSIQSYGKLLILFMLVLLPLASCTDDGAGIFYSIEIEEEIDDGSLPNYLTAFSYAQTSTDNMYYLAGGSLYTWDADSSSEDWSKMSLPSGWNYTWQVASDGTDILYVIVENSDGDSTALYTWDSTNGWQGSYSVGDGRPYRLWYANSQLYVATQETEDEDEKDYNYMLYVETTPAALDSFQQITVDGSSFVSSNLPVKDLSYDPDNFEILFITSESVYSGSGITFFVDSDATPSGKYLRNIHYSTTHSDIFISCADDTINEDGYVYQWDGTTLTYFDDVGDDPNDFGDITFDGTDYLLVGTKNGYYESAALSSSFSGESSTINSSSEYEITDLYSSVIQGLFDSGTSNLFFAMTSGNGLWRNSDGDWSRE